MRLKNQKIIDRQKLDTLICIALGTASGLLVYGIFLYFNIGIFGWNLGLIFAPLIAGYVETILANRLIGENIGAISAFILFIYVTYYSFILKNPTLGFNLITAGSLLVILQAAFPTLTNFIILILAGIIASSFHKTYKKIAKHYDNRVRYRKLPQKKGKRTLDEEIPTFDEIKSNETLNNLEFSFYTTTDLKNEKYEIIGIYQSDIFIERDINIIHADPDKNAKEFILNIKQGKDESLVELAKQIKKNNGNGIIDLTINYSLIGKNGNHIQITAMGMGILIQ